MESPDLLESSSSENLERMGSPDSEVENPPWEDLPAELLLKIVNSSSGTAGMRGACQAWKTGLESVITKLRLIEVGFWPAHLSSQLACRFPLLTCLEAPDCQLCESEGLEKLRRLPLTKLAASFPFYLSGGNVEPVLDKLREMQLDELDLWAGHFLPVEEHILSRLHGLPIVRLDVEDITDAGLLGIRTMPLTSLRLCSWKRALEVTDNGLESLQGMRLKEFCITSRSSMLGITDSGLSVFRGMPLAVLKLYGCSKITDQGLEVFRGMSLSSFSFYCSSDENITDAGLEVLRGMPLTELSLLGCSQITLSGLEYFRCMPLKSLELLGLNDAGLNVFTGMALTHLHLYKCPDLTDIGLDVLLGMPLVRLNLDRCTGLTNSIFENVLQCLPLERLDLRESTVTDQGLEWLRGLPLTSIHLDNCQRITAEGVLTALADMPLCNLRLQHCGQVMDSYVWEWESDEADRGWVPEFIDVCRSKL